MSIREIQVLLDYANFYCHFIRGLSKIAVLLISMQKTISETPPKVAENFTFLIFEAKLAFFLLKQAFIKALILYNSNLKCHNLVETDVFSYDIDGILCWLTLKASQWHFVAFYLRKMIPVEF